MHHELPQGHEYAQEKKPPDLYKKSLLVQTKIVERLSDEAARHAWIESNAARFRDLLDNDEAFEKLVLDEDVDGILQRLEQDVH
jgi:hypothetical protein